jgi:hypothetical protein
MSKASEFLRSTRRGSYRGRDEQDTYWGVERATSSRWEVYEDGSEVYDGATLAECVLYIDSIIRERSDPEYRARVEARRDERRRRQARRAA